MAQDHQAQVAHQFGGQAQAYVTSAVHASGADLDWMEAFVAAAKPERALDLGCGGGHVSYRACAHAGEVTAYDLSEQMLAAVREAAAERGIGNLVTRQGPAERLPFEDASFDMVLSRFSAHHWSDFEGGLREAARVLKPGGAAILVDGVSPGPATLDTHLQAIETLRDPSHVRDYAIGEWGAAANRAGLLTRSVRTDRLRMEFASWTERMRTPRVAIEGIRYMQGNLHAAARAHFEIEADGSFMLDTAWFEMVRPGR